MRVELRRQHSGRDRRYLGAVIEDARGDLVLEGQDLGPATGFISPRGEYEYWVTVHAEHRDTVLVMLVTERFGGDAEAVRPWLKRNGFGFRGRGRGAIEQVQVAPGGAVRIETSGGTIVVSDVEYDRLTLALLGDLFASKRFESDVPFRAWLTEHDVPTEFSSF